MRWQGGADMGNAALLRELFLTVAFAIAGVLGFGAAGVAGGAAYAFLEQR